MGTYVVDLVIEISEPLTVAQLEAIASVGGAAAGDPGGHRVETTVTVDADNMAEAIEHARPIFMDWGRLVAASVMHESEADRRLAEPAFPELAGAAEVAAMLGISRQRLADLRARQEFPSPVAHLASGPVWRKRDLTTFAAGWQRKPGRPRKVTAAR